MEFSKLNNSLPQIEGYRRYFERPSFIELFSDNKPMMGMIHLPQLPGYDGREATQEEITSLTQKALRDLYALSFAGFDAVVVENHGDDPPPNPDNPMSPQAKRAFEQVLQNITQVAHQLRMPVGINLVFDFMANIDIAHSVRADFVRIDVFADAMINHHRNFIAQPTSSEIIRRNQELEEMDGHHVAILADVQVKHFEMIDKEKPFWESVVDTIAQGADAIVVTGSWTGIEPSVEELSIARKIAGLKNIPVLIGSGLNTGNARSLLIIGDGAIVGTSIKTGEYVDPGIASVLIWETKR